MNLESKSDEPKPCFSEQVTESLLNLGQTNWQFDQQLSTFEKQIQELPSTTFIGAIYKDLAIPRPVIELYLVFANPLSYRNSEQSDEILRVIDEHGKLALQLDPSFDCFLDLVDPRTVKTAEDFASFLQFAANRTSTRSVLGQQDLRTQ